MNYLNESESIDEDFMEFLENTPTLSDLELKRRNNAFCLKGMDASKAYLSGHAYFWLRLRAAKVVELEIEPTSWANFYACIKPCGISSERNTAINFPTSGENPMSSRNGGCWSKEIMPIRVSQNFQTIKNIPSRVTILCGERFDTVYEDIRRLYSYPCLYSPSYQIVEGIFSPSDWEEIASGDRFKPPMFDNKSDVNVVQSRNEIENTISNYQRPHTGNFSLDGDVKKFISALDIECSSNLVTFGVVEKFAGLRLQILDVMIGPFDLEKRSFKLFYGLEH